MVCVLDCRVGLVSVGTMSFVLIAIVALWFVRLHSWFGCWGWLLSAILRLMLCLLFGFCVLVLLLAVLLVGSVVL